MRSFMKIKPSRIGDIFLSLTDIGKSCPVRNFFYVANVSLNAIGKNIIIAKITDFTVMPNTVKRGILKIVIVTCAQVQNDRWQLFWQPSCVSFIGKKPYMNLLK